MNKPLNMFLRRPLGGFFPSCSGSYTALVDHMIAGITDSAAMLGLVTARVVRTATILELFSPVTIAAPVIGKI